MRPQWTRGTVIQEDLVRWLGSVGLGHHVGTEKHTLKPQIHPKVFCQMHKSEFRPGSPKGWTGLLQDQSPTYGSLKPRVWLVNLLRFEAPVVSVSSHAELIPPNAEHLGTTCCWQYDVLDVLTLS